MNNNQGNKFFTNMPVTPDNNQNNNIQNQFSQNIPQINNQNIIILIIIKIGRAHV